MSAGAPAPPYIGVIGASRASSDQLATAEAVGRELALHGAVLVCGGRGGVMEAACAGARGEGGLTIGLLPGSDRSEANPHVVAAIATGLGELRNGLIVRASDALIAVGGESGTLSEIALALKAGRPVLGLSTWELDGVERAGDASEAVRRALELAGRSRRPRT